MMLNDFINVKSLSSELNWSIGRRPRATTCIKIMLNLARRQINCIFHYLESNRLLQWFFFLIPEKARKQILFVLLKRPVCFISRAKKRFQYYKIESVYISRSRAQPFTNHHTVQAVNADKISSPWNEVKDKIVASPMSVPNEIIPDPINFQ